MALIQFKGKEQITKSPFGSYFEYQFLKIVLEKLVNIILVLSKTCFVFYVFRAFQKKKKTKGIKLVFFLFLIFLLFKNIKQF